MSDISYGSDPLQKLDVYLPADLVRGTIVWFHPGGWCCGDKANIDPLVLSTIDQGYALVSVNYRLVPDVTAEQQLADVDRAIRFIKGSRCAWGAGTDKLVVAGGSAGGTLALLAIAAPKVFAGPDLGPLAEIDPNVDAVISLVGPSDLRSYVDGTIGGWGTSLGEGFLGCTSRESPDPATTTSLPTCESVRVLKFSPVFWAALTAFLGERQLPPAYLAYGSQDSLVPPSSQGVPLHDWWATAGNWLATYYDNPPNGGHNLSFDVNATAFSLWLRTFVSN